MKCDRCPIADECPSLKVLLNMTHRKGKTTCPILYVLTMRLVTEDVEKTVQKK